jgi:tetratricopeptide (TPR) repeat protein
VKELLDRADHEPPSQAKHTVDEAIQLVLKTADRSNGLAVGRAAFFLARRRQSVGDLTGASGFAKQSLDVHLRFVPNSLQVAASLNLLGVLARSRGDLTGAQRFFQDSLELRRGRARPVILAQSLNNLGMVALEQRDLPQARSFFQQVVDLQSVNPRRAQPIWRALNNLGFVALGERNLPEATRQFRQALGYKADQGSEDLERAMSFIGLSRVLDANGLPRPAIQRLRKALRVIHERAAYALWTRFLLRDLARLQLENGAPGEAAKSLKQAEQVEAEIQSLPQPRSGVEGSPLSLILPQTRQLAPPDYSEAAEPELDEESGTSLPPPQVRILAPAEGSDISGNEVRLTVEVLSPRPVTHCHIWINGRPLAFDQGFSLPPNGQKQPILERGLILSKDLTPTQMPGARAVPLSAAGPSARFRDSRELQITLPLAAVDGPSVQIEVVAETAHGNRSDRQIRRLHRLHVSEQPGVLHVLAVGISGYWHVSKLNFAAADARDLAAVMQTQGGVGKPFQKADVTPLTDGEATLKNLRNALELFTSNVQPGDTLLLLLSGHGVKQGDRFYFAPVDLDLANVSGTGLPWSEVLTRLSGARRQARMVWLLADCCRAAPDLRREHVEARGADLDRGVGDSGNLVVCTAATGDQSSYESKTLAHGLFTQAWLETLRGQAPNLFYTPFGPGRVLSLSALQFLLGNSVIAHALQENVDQEVEFPLIAGSFLPNQPVFFVPVSRSVAPR